MRPIKIFLASLGFRKTVLGTAPPLGIMYLAAYLRTKLRAEFRIVNQRLHNDPDIEIVKQAKAFGADVIGLSVLTTNAHTLPFITHHLKAALPKALIVIGGPHVSAFGDKSLNGNSADVAVPFEGELAFEAVINNHFHDGNMAGVPGIFRREESQIISNPGSLPFTEDIDALPFPAYDLIDIKSYWKNKLMNVSMRKKYVSLFSSRGCPFKCIYCHRIFGDRLRVHSAARVVEEIKFYMKHFGAECFEFEDDIFNHNQKRLFEICEGVVKLGAKTGLSFPTGLRMDGLSKTSIDALAAAGMYFCSCPLESGSPRIQKLIEKNLNIPKYLENVNYMASKKIFTLGFTMMGFPSETKEDIQHTIDIVCSSRAHAASFWPVVPFPNTKIYDIAMSDYREKLKCVDYKNNEYPYIQSNYADVSDEELAHLQKKATRDFYLNPDRIFRILRDFPQKGRLPMYIPEFLKRISKGIVP